MSFFISHWLKITSFIRYTNYHTKHSINYMFMKKYIIIVFFALFPYLLHAQETEKQYLSGTGLYDTKTWDFNCSDGMNSKSWQKIEVPSNWEVQGFGAYTYGRWYKKKGEKPSNEVGTYRYNFRVSKKWEDKQISIVFEGSMTDTEVFINGKKAGPTHQGAFYCFSYDITDKVLIGKKNKLEVIVHKESENYSINNAERKADWWLFGGIYRPVYLEAKPQIAFKHVAIDAKADGTLNADIQLSQEVPSGIIEASIKPLTGAGTFEDKTIQVSEDTLQKITTKWDNVYSWNPERPQLYILTLKLKNANNEVLHEWTSRIGFRTVEFRPMDGIYVNGTKIIMKGINRHSFYPTGGRTTDREISLKDVLLLKEMNINAVRSHYPPDSHFLDMCDSIGLFVMDELAGWQNCYDSEVGPILLKEMIKHDVNHPSIIIWSNGNEGGWNYDLDAHFADYDPQNRHVVHPWADWNDIDAHHYPTYLTGVARFTNGYKVFLPTEFMHGMYDQGLGAGLEDFWTNWCTSPLFAGGFMWSFADNAVIRKDRNDKLDSDDFRAPDGIVGPYREKEGSVYTVREVWSPIQFKKLYITPSFDGTFTISNTYLYTNLEKCTMKYRLLKISSPLNGSAQKTEIDNGEAQLPEIAPGETQKMHMILPDNFFDGDVLEMEAFDPYGRSIGNWSWPIKYAQDYYNEQSTPDNISQKANVTIADTITSLKANGVSVSFSNTSGQILKVENSEGVIPFNNGPVAVGMKIKFKNSYISKTDTSAMFVAKYLGGIDSIVWCMNNNGILTMNAVMLNKARGGQGFDDAFTDTEVLNFGLTFSYPEKSVKGMEWFGRGPYRVWKNRIKGTNYNLWQKDYNNTITGESDYGLEYPEFKGYHANLYWATVQSDEHPFTIYAETDGVFLRMLTPEEPKGRQGGKNTMPDFPDGDISFLYDIPAIRAFKPTSQQGPHSQPGNIRIKVGDEGIRMKLAFDFR